MTRFQKIKETVFGFIMLGYAVLLFVSPSNGYTSIIAILSLYFTLMGLRRLIYYFTMARFMVGGRGYLYTAIIMLDFGILTGTLEDVPHYYVLIYLIALHAFSGAIRILRALEARRYGAGSWKVKFSHGIFDVVLAMVCVIFIKHMSMAVIIFSIGLAYSSVLRIISGLRKTKFIYIR